MNRASAIGEWQRALKALGSAEVLLREEYEADAVSRAYYAIMHAAKAALFVHDVATTSHVGTKRMFGLHLVRPNRIEPEWSGHLAEGSDERLAADYDVHSVFSNREAERECTRARAFLDRIRRYLIESGLNEEELSGEP